MSTSQYPASKGRRFALTVAAAFAVLAAISFWRGRQTAPLILSAAAAALVVAGILFPSRLGPLEGAWMKLAHAISRVTTPIFMSIVYFVVLTPIGFLRRVFGRNALVHRPAGGSYWIARVKTDAEAERRRMERQF